MVKVVLNSKHGRLYRMLEDQKRRQAIERKKAICPICRRVYEYLGEIPKTCGRFICIWKAKFVLKIL